MSSVTYNRQWDSAQAELRKLLREEVPKPPPLPMDGTGDAPPAPEIVYPTERGDIIDMLRLRFVRYLRTVKKLEDCYDQIIQPQKRILLRRLLDTAMGRLLEIKRELVDMDCSEFHYLDDILTDLKLTPQDIEMPVPKYFLQRQALVERMERLKNMMNRFNIHSSHDIYQQPSFEKPMSTEEALALIQRHERARQGILRSKFMEHIRKEEARRIDGSDSSTGLSQKDAVAKISHWYNQILIKRRAVTMRQDELKFIGMRSDEQLGEQRLPNLLKPFADDELAKAARTQELRRQRRHAHEQDYQEALITIQDTIKKVDGPDMREQMQDQIRQWYIECRDKLGKFPDYPSAEEGGSLKIFVEKTPEEIQAEIEAKEAKAGGKKGKKGKKDGGKKDKKGGKKGKKGKGKDDEGDQGWKPKPSNFLEEMDKDADEYEQVWRVRDERDNFQQRHDENIVREEKTRAVEAEIRISVDEIMREELEQLRSILDKAKKGKKGKGKKKKGKGKKGKKGKKEKDYTPDRTTADLYEEMVQNGIIKKPRYVPMDSVISEFSYLATTLRQDNREPMPSLHDIKNLVSLYCVMPLGSQKVHENAPHIKSCLLAGPAGVGKRTLVDAVCTETGANLFDLSPKNVYDKYPGKAGLNILLDMVIKVGRAMAPSVVWIGQAESMFMKKMPKGALFDPRRLKKDFPKAFMKRLRAEDRILVMGTSREPHAADMKTLCKNFEKVVLIPKPDYATRFNIWKSFIMDRVRGVEDLENEMIKVDISSLAQITNGWTAGMIKECIHNTMTERRLQNLSRKSLVGEEFIRSLSVIEPIFKEQEEELAKWYKKTPLGKKREKLAKSAGGDEAEGGKGKGKKGKGGKKKKK